ncbi:glucose/quinate/shikimate family membrane-bound PQQ-dependent dehydrogenase [Paraburkholderia madseniana]|uniref:Glucose/quinate/shikimate family membrane-bound PQQ-dependent dehydrogenase n=1 Tax=Paraburkholderia madseniana TaxID=2599607 RepID=A0AAP5B8X3_9BURK|nr:MULTISPECIES: glucose/quinate/shikimate family membrane-bound PQQ-dependent dehydrogenase [Paraburkholderia]MCX4144247.1 glucose/quinate/shikimate family membrane-bound PQQ-dependent dehydrogenase [Paraburkholderia madseniana]MDN7147200.1 glucose/quinate/shikimate family membrane-bound PQQ-dependent dehydrogenase [Paraburkholderia sp. WS6]MDQ6406080.1 glucose/quinate/shikimate family membrane-bound PQQ-dependent dehydrogenase [Paraburkholderia madseniana]
MTSQSNSRGVIGVITLLFTVLTALYLLIGGAWLLAVGGSAYYVVTGIVLLGVAWLLWRRSPAALVLYALVLIGTAIWALYESGPDFWALAPRSGVLVIFGVWLLLLVSWRLEGERKLGVASLVVALVAWAGILVYANFNDPQQVNGTLNASAPASVASTGIDASDWPAYGRTQEGTRYSPLQQITPENVKNLQVAWTFRTGDMKGPNDPVEITNEVTPIKIGDLLYLCSPHQILFALDAKTGTLKWKFDPRLKNDPSFQHVTCRGVSYVDLSASATAAAPAAAPASDAAAPAAASASDAAAATDASGAAATPASGAAVADASGPATAACTRRIYLPVNDGHLYALDALTGQRCAGFGNNGDLDLQHAQPVTTPGMYEPTSPSIITSKVIVVAGAVEDNFSNREPSGVIRGFDVRTGELLWAFDPGAKDPNHIPGPGEHYTWNSPNSWAPAAYDAKLDIVYLPMGVKTPDIWGGDRTPELEQYATGLLALNASTGKLAWFYQSVHHDLWDMDQPSQPTIADITGKDGKTVPVVYAPAKTGNLFVLDRRTGALVVPAPETPVPQGAAPGDHVAPTQPFSQLTYRPSKNLTDADMWGATMFDQLVCRVMFHKLRYEGTFTPPSLQGTLVFPGNLGVFEWGGLAVDTDRQIAVANPIGLPFVSRLIPRGPGNPLEPEPGAKGSGTESGIQPQYGVPYGVTINPFLSPLGLPCKQPAWGYISAIDLKTNEIVWKKRIGTVRDSSPIPLPFKMGMPMLGGPSVTAGGVAFIGATADNYIRAFNVNNGEQVWEARLPAGGQATPMSYSINGRQYVVIAAGGHGSFGTKLGDYVIAYALPPQ